VVHHAALPQVTSPSKITRAAEGSRSPGDGGAVLGNRCADNSRTSVPCFEPEAAMPSNLRSKIHSGR